MELDPQTWQLAPVDLSLWPKKIFLNAGLSFQMGNGSNDQRYVINEMGNGWF